MSGSNESAVGAPTVPTADWAGYNAWNARDRAMSALWIRPFVAWLDATGRLGADRRVLDYGCSHFDLGAALRGRVRRVDGFDVDPGAVASAAARFPGAADVTIYDDAHAIPDRAYDLVVLNSVLQYLPSEAAVETLLGRLGRMLAAQADVAIVVSDVIPPSYVPALDALQSLAHATRHGLARPMLVHLWKAATKPSGHELLRLDPVGLTAMAARVGLAAAPLQRNLTPSRSRYSVVLTPVG